MTMQIGFCHCKRDIILYLTSVHVVLICNVNKLYIIYELLKDASTVFRKPWTLGGLDSLNRFSPIFLTKKELLLLPVNVSAQRSPWKNGSTLKGSKFFPLRVDPFSRGSKFFPSRVDPFSEASQNNFHTAAFKTIFIQLPSLKVYQFPLTHCILVTPERVIGKQCRPRSDATERLRTVKPFFFQNI